MGSEKQRTALIFGGAGFVGANWAERLLATTDARVHVFDNLSRRGVHHNLEWLKKIDSSRLQVTIADVRDVTAVERAVRAATEIYHFAAQVAVTTALHDPRFDFEVNAGGTINILEAARRAEHRPFLLFTSTNKVYGEMEQRPLVATSSRYRYADGGGVDESAPLDFHTPYGCSKGAADQYVRDYARSFGIPAVVLRMSCIAGPRQFGNEDQGWVAHLLYCAMEQRPAIFYGDGRQVRDVLYVGDLLNAFEAVRDQRAQAEGEVFNVGGGPENTLSLLELVDEIERMSGQRLRYTCEPMRQGDQLVYVSDTSKLARATGWRPQTGIQETLSALLDWWTRNRALLPRLMPIAAPAAASTPVLQELPRTA